MGYQHPKGMPESAIEHPSDTITFGEKLATSGHVHMDYYQGYGNEIEEIDQSKHGAGARTASGGSNFTFADGSVRFLGFGKSITPVNMWGTTEQWRTSGSPAQ